MSNEGEPIDKLGDKYGRVRNKAPAPIQITAEQLLREAYDRRSERIGSAPRPLPVNEKDAESIKLVKRRDFEERLRKNRQGLTNWFKYARFEESVGEIDRARSLFERALDMNPRNITVWLKYAEMEMRHKQINHARNIWDRAVLILPRVNQFWYKYTYMEEILGNVANARHVFERWMQWQPHEQAWLSYIKMELRYKEINRARAIYERFVTIHPDVGNWIRFAKFEQRFASTGNARIVYEKAVEYFSHIGLEPKLVLAFARFEEQCCEVERARAIFKYAIDNLPKNQIEYGYFEKRHGDKQGIEDVIVAKRKNFYEQNVETNPFDYDSWIDMIRLMENEEFELGKIRDAYERAISNIPPIEEKPHWRRYLYIWIMYALYEELKVKDFSRVRKVYKAILDLIPHRKVFLPHIFLLIKFTFAKIWILAANFEIRQNEISSYRKLMLREFERCRKLYEKYLEFNPFSSLIWLKYAEMEATLGNTERARGLFNLGVSQTQLNIPELLWKSYIDFELGQEEYGKVRKLYEELLGRTSHVKIWINYAKFELKASADNDPENARKIFSRASQYFKDNYQSQPELVSQRIALLEAWHDFELNYGNENTQESVKNMLPKKIKKRRKVTDMVEAENDEAIFSWEEYFDYTFPEDMDKQSNFKLLQLAHQWAKKKEQMESDARTTIT